MDHGIIMRVKILCKSKRCHDDKERRKRVQRVFLALLRITSMSGWVAAADRRGCLLSTGVRKPLKI